MPHIDFLWQVFRKDKGPIPPTMEIDDDLEPFLVSEPIGPFLDRLNFGVQPFAGGIGNRMRETGQNIFNVTFDRCADLSSVSGRCEWPTRTIASGSPGRRPLSSPLHSNVFLHGPSAPDSAFSAFTLPLGKSWNSRKTAALSKRIQALSPFWFFLRAGHSFWTLAFDLLIIPLLGPSFRLLGCSSQGMEEAPHMIGIVQTE